MIEQQPAARPGMGKQLVGIAFAGVFLWLAFRGADPAKLWTYIQQVQPVFLAAVFLSGLASHLLRAWRWVLLLQPLSERKISFWNSFCAVMYGYAVNVVVPRGGEVARLVSISKSEDLPWVGVLSTMFIDRLLDIALLVLLLGATLVAFPMPEGMSFLVPGGIGLTVATLSGLVALPRMAAIINWALTRKSVTNRLSANIINKVEQLAAQFDTGCKSLTNPITYPAIGLLSVAIWFCYWLNFYFMIWAFNLNGKVSAMQSLTVFTIGSVGVLVPTPGNVGSFHYLVSQALAFVSGINSDQSLAFASLLHAFCFVIVTCLPAAICFVMQSRATGKKGPANSAVQATMDHSGKV